MRRREVDLETDIAETLEGALHEVGLTASRRTRQLGNGHRPDLFFDIGGQAVVVEVKSVVRETDASSLVAQLMENPTPGLVAADRIAEGAKEEFIKAGVGFFDRRGRLRLVVPGAMFVDTFTHPSAAHLARSGVLAGEVAKEVAILLLSDCNHRLGVRQLAALANRAPSSVFEALKRLRAAGLVSTSNEPRLPDLFWELEAQWTRDPHALAAIPSPRDSEPFDVEGVVERDLGGEATLPEIDVHEWVLTGAVAAAAWGIPLDGPTHPPDFYVPSWAALHEAVAALGMASQPDDRACTVQVAPAGLVCRRRQFRPGSTWPVADHVVVALDVANDHERGREALVAWRPEGLVRVW